MATLAEQISDITAKWAKERTDNATNILLKYGINDTMVLPSSVISNQRITPTGILIEFFANDYYIFVDQGVKGIGFSSYKTPKGRVDKLSKVAYGSQKMALTTGKYKYKTPFVNKEMVANVAAWISRKGILLRASSSESKQSVIKKKESVAWAIAKNIKRTGIGKTMFWSDTFNEEAYIDLANRIGKELGREITITL